MALLRYVVLRLRVELHRSSGRSKQRESHRVGAFAIAVLTTDYSTRDIFLLQSSNIYLDVLFLCKSSSDHDGSAIGSCLRLSRRKSRDSRYYRLSIGFCLLLLGVFIADWRRLYRIAPFGSSASPTHIVSSFLATVLL